MEPVGTIVFTSVGRPNYGFDIFSVQLPSDSDIAWDPAAEHRLTDGVSVNFNGQFVGDDGSTPTLVYISERTGSARVFLKRPGEEDPEQLHTPPESLFHDRPVVRGHRLYFISAHEEPEKPFRSWTALYSTRLDDDKGRAVARLTPYGSADYSPAVSQSGKLIAVASYGARPWAGEFHHLQTDIVVFQESNPAQRLLVCRQGGWPTWSGDSTIYFHRQAAEDGWWSIFRADLPDTFLSSPEAVAPTRVTPPGVHCFTPAAMRGNRIAVATRRKGNDYRHIEVFDVESHRFYPVTQLLNPDLHHYNPFVSSSSSSSSSSLTVCHLGYHRFGGGGGDKGPRRIPHLEAVTSPAGLGGVRMFRLNGSFPSFSPSGDLIAFNPDFDVTKSAGLRIVKFNGSRGWTLFENRTAFHNSWSPDENVIFTSIGPIFTSEGAAVQIARVTFDRGGAEGSRSIPADIKILTKEGTGNNAFPSCSPDGRSVVFRSGRSGHKNLYIVDAVEGEGGRIFQLTEGPWTDTMPSWSPDGQWIAFSSNRHSLGPGKAADGFGIYLIRPDGSGLRRVTVVSGEGERERLNHVCFSGDGGWLLFTANLGGVTADPVSIPNQFQPYGELYMVRLDGSGLRRLTWNGYEDGTPAWHPTTLLPRLLPEVEDQDEDGDEGDRLDGRFDEPLWIKCE
ncbi:uncharacterized protein LOC127258710 [Andrographis paniculata]|uniref:uncharacterized protein LOC127258710 n=1 Tax=Andrographis paniculata TaxID=175694 RepID=UPI0021E95E25|nr:uncharacterized protein LOC127258710 [Andrographis paniculata]